MVKTISTTRKINTILLNINTNRPKLVSGCVDVNWQKIGKIYIAWVKILQNILGGVWLALYIVRYIHTNLLHFTAPINSQSKHITDLIESNSYSDCLASNPVMCSSHSANFGLHNVVQRSICYQNVCLSVTLVIHV